VPDRIEAFRLACQMLAILKDDARLVPLAARLVRELDPCKHTPDFASVLWNDKLYHFTPLQSKAVRLLWQAWEQGGMGLRQEWLLETIGSDCARLADLFKDHPAWGAMIQPAGSGRGTFALGAEPPAVQA
jgi:hypothetical protein